MDDDYLNSRISIENIKKAYDIIDPVFLNTPQFRYKPLESKLGLSFITKIEVFNPVRSFKGRGASFIASALEKGSTVVCASAGNLGQAIAYNCEQNGIKSVIFASIKASPIKIELMKRFGADVILTGDDFDDAKIAAKDYAHKNGFLLIEDSLDIATCEGAGTIGIELLKHPEPIDAILVALGNGAMLTGIAAWVKQFSAKTEIIGVVSKGAACMKESFEKNRIIQHKSINTIADGIAVRTPIPEVLGDMNILVDKVLAVDDEQIIDSMKILYNELGLVCEPSGAVGLAALINNKNYFKDKLSAIIVCGGNLSNEQYAQYLY